MTTPTYTLSDGVKLHAENPDTFAIPSDEDKAAITRGSFVKLIFSPTEKSDDTMPERMWVEVTHLDNGGERITGTLANNPLSLESPQYGDEIHFTPDNIIAISP